jgi:glucosamine-6-phosphate deaminase
MEVIVCKSPEESADLVAGLVLDALAATPDLVLGLATGSTPIGVYQRLIAARRGGVDFSRVRTFNLDEYVGLAPGHPQSYRAFMDEHLFCGLNVPAENIHFPPAGGPDLLAKCRAYDDAIEDAGGIDIQILGIGGNGHIGFNEPTSSLASSTRIKTLTDKTLADNSRFYAEGETQPNLATTMGIGTILNASRIFLQAFGAKKAEAIRQSIEGPISSFWPGSALQLHPDTTFFLDEESAAGLQMLDYYKRTRRIALELDEQGVL